jgi:hypothetical protein
MKIYCIHNIQKHNQRELVYEDVATSFWSAMLEISELVGETQKLSKTEDNKEFYLSLPQKIQDLFDMKIQFFGFPEKEFEAMYSNVADYMPF